MTETAPSVLAKEPPTSHGASRSLVLARKPAWLGTV